MLEQIGKLEEALYNIQFEQHWLEAQTDRQALGMFLHPMHLTTAKMIAWLFGLGITQLMNRSCPIQEQVSGCMK